MDKQNRTSSNNNEDMMDDTVMYNDKWEYEEWSISSDEILPGDGRNKNTFDCMSLECNEVKATNKDNHTSQSGNHTIQLGNHTKDITTIIISSDEEDGGNMGKTVKAVNEASHANQIGKINQGDHGTNTNIEVNTGRNKVSQDNHITGMGIVDRIGNNNVSHVEKKRNDDNIRTNDSSREGKISIRNEGSRIAKTGEDNNTDRDDGARAGEEVVNISRLSTDGGPDRSTEINKGKGGETNNGKDTIYYGLGDIVPLVRENRNEDDESQKKYEEMSQVTMQNKPTGQKRRKVHEDKIDKRLQLHKPDMVEQIDKRGLQKRKTNNDECKNKKIAGESKKMRVKVGNPNKELRKDETQQKNNANNKRTTNGNTKMKNNKIANTEQDLMVIEEIKGGFEDRTEGNIMIPQSVKSILSLGPNFVIPYNRYKLKDIVNLVDDTQNVWDETGYDDKTNNMIQWKNKTINSMISEEAHLGAKQRNITKMVLELETFINDNQSICIQESDKGKKTILLYKKDYNMMIIKFMKNAEIIGLYVPIDNVYDKTSETIMMNREMALLRLNLTEWRRNGIFKERNSRTEGKEKTLWDIVLNVVGKIPKMNFIVKAHKEVMGIRNICPKNNTVSFGVSKVIAQLLNNVVKKDFMEMGYCDTNIYNITEWAKMINKAKINDDEILVVFDVKEMFNNIDRETLLTIIKMNTDETMYNIGTIMSMCKYELNEDNYVIYNGKFYVQMRGVPMGAPSSGVHAKIYIDFWLIIIWDELKILGCRMIAKNVDDLFMIVNRNNYDKIIKLMENKMKLEITASCEDENGCVEFYDMLVIHDRANEWIITKKNKKEYTSNRMIHAESNQDEAAKRSKIMDRIQRTIDLTSGELLNTTLLNDVEIILNNGYNIKEVERAINRIKSKWNTRQGNEDIANVSTHNEVLEKVRIIEESFNAIRKVYEEDNVYIERNASIKTKPNTSNNK